MESVEVKKSELNNSSTKHMLLWVGAAFSQVDMIPKIMYIFLFHAYVVIKEYVFCKCLLL